METHHSIACIAYEKNKILIAKRIDKGDMGNRWEFPGGKVEEGESETDAIIREMGEEFGIRVSVLEKITESEFTHKDKKNYLSAYRIGVPHLGLDEKYILTEHTDYKWVEPKEIETLDFVDSDFKIYPVVLEKIKSWKK